MFRVRLLLSYDGTNYFGWQRQKNSTPSIQGTLEKCLSQIFNQPIQVIGSGRTDAGAHALGQVCHFDAPKDPRTFPLIRALQHMLPHDLSVHKGWLVPNSFHALFSVQKKIYRYYILNRPRPSAFFNRYSWWLERPISTTWLNQASQFLIGTHDFKSFQTQGTPVKTTVRQIYKAQWAYGKNGLLVFTICGSGFLKQMVRNIVGTLIDLERQKVDPSTLGQILSQRDRRAAGPTAPSSGLFLAKVKYPAEIECQCLPLPS